MSGLKIIIEVHAGIIPQVPIPEFSKQWNITFEEFCEEGDAVSIKYGHAQEYSRNLWNPNRVNWVSLTWIYL